MKISFSFLIFKNSKYAVHHFNVTGLKKSVKSDDNRSCGLSLSKRTGIGFVPGSLIVGVFGDAGLLKNSDHAKKEDYGVCIVPV
jgi:hypothetical protein